MPGWLVSEDHLVSGRLQWLFCHGPLRCLAVNNCGNSLFWFCDFFHGKFCFRQKRYIFQRSNHNEQLSNFLEYLKTKKTCHLKYLRGRSKGYWQSVPMFLRISSTRDTTFGKARHLGEIDRDPRSKIHLLARCWLVCKSVTLSSVIQTTRGNRGEHQLTVLS